MINGVQFEEVQSLRYLGVALSKDGRDRQN